MHFTASFERGSIRTEVLVFVVYVRSRARLDEPEKNSSNPSVCRV